MNKIILLVFILLGFIGNAFSGIKTISCANCSDAQKQKAAEMLSQQLIDSKVVIMDYATETAQKYEVFSSKTKWGDPTTNAYPISFSSAEKSDVNTIFEYRRELVKMLKTAEAKALFDVRAFHRVDALPTNLVNNNFMIDAHDSGAYYVGGSVRVEISPDAFYNNSRLRNNFVDYFANYAPELNEITSGTLYKIHIPKMKDADLRLEIIFTQPNDNDVMINSDRVFVSINFDTESLEFVDANYPNKNM